MPRYHWRTNPVGLPFHVPVEQVSVDPIEGVPVIAGETVFSGRCTAAAGTLNEVELAVLLPAELVAVICTRIKRPASPLRMV